MRLFAAIIAFALLLTGSAALPSAEAQEEASLSGRVCAAGHPDEGCHGRGLPGANVSLRPTGTLGSLPTSERTTQSGADGEFRFDGLEDGAYELTVSRPGFEDVAQNLQIEGKHWSDVPMRGQEVEVEVRVLGPEGPIAGARVMIASEQGHGRMEAGTDEEGLAMLEVRAGHHRIEVRAGGFLPHERGGVLLDGQGVHEVRLEPGPVQTAVLEGQVLDQDGSPVADAQVELWQHGGHAVRPMASDGGAEPAQDDVAYSTPAYSGSNRTTTDGDGRYTIHVYAGEVSLSVRKEGHASYHDSLRVEENQTVEQDVELLRFPEKTARVEGRAVDAQGRPVGDVSVGFQHPEYGIWECSTHAEDRREDPPTDDAPERSNVSSERSTTVVEPMPNHCAIEVQEDGTFSGLVTPGYGILRVHHDLWRSCGERSDDCGPEHLPHVETLVLEADATTALTVRLQARPGADAVASGYILDGSTQQTVPEAHISFSNQETHGWGSAQTDGDGSYALRLRAGFHHVSVWAQGYLPWEGTVEVPADGQLDLDVTLTPGQSRYGGCCYAYAEERLVADKDAGDDEAGGPAGMPQNGSARDMAAGEGSARDMAAGEGSARDMAAGGSGEATYEDLGGGLGPYNAQERSRLSEGEEASALPLLGLLAVLGLALVLRRRS